MKKSFDVAVKCVFCDSILEKENDKEPMDGEILKCSNCGRDNDVSTVRDLAIKKFQESEEFQNYIQNEITKNLKIKLK